MCGQILSNSGFTRIDLLKSGLFLNEILSWLSLTNLWKIMPKSDLIKIHAQVRFAILQIMPKSDLIANHAQVWFAFIANHAQVWFDCKSCQSLAGLRIAPSSVAKEIPVFENSIIGSWHLPWCVLILKFLINVFCLFNIHPLIHWFIQLYLTKIMFQNISLQCILNYLFQIVWISVKLPTVFLIWLITVVK